jgi:hypothetical protein
LEDPFLRKEYEETLKKEGVKSKMEESLYQPPSEVQSDRAWDVAAARS